jgi:hypothetical protein
MTIVPAAGPALAATGHARTAPAQKTVIQERKLMEPTIADLTG